MPLFAVCAVAAPERVGELQHCAQTLTGAKAADDLEDSLPLKLLADVRNVWVADTAHMATATLLGGVRARAGCGGRARRSEPRSAAGGGSPKPAHDARDAAVVARVRSVRPVGA